MSRALLGSLTVFAALMVFAALTVLAAPCSPLQAADDRPLRAVQRGVDYLLAQQGEDGIWHSPNYGSLRHGAAVTALVLYSIGHTPQTCWATSTAKLERAFSTLGANSAGRSYVSNPDGPDYSNYATAMVLVALDRLQLNAEERRRRWVEYLVAAQLTAEEGLEADDVDFGGWDMSGWMTGQRATTGTNISTTCAVIEALSGEESTPLSREALRRAALWLGRCQNPDGGFFFHPQIGHDGNKAGWSDASRRHAESYGTCTADGLRALRYLGVSEDDSRVEAAANWLNQFESIEPIPGLTDESWQQGLRYYYWYSLAKALSQLPEGRRRALARQIIDELVSRQQPDGHWENASARMREDDPLIATSFALVGLCEALRALGE